jgi:putative ABC transport system ATP-binding protein
VVGPSGSGKSTLLNVVGLLDRPTEGSYQLDGVDTSSLTERGRTRLRATTLGFVFQSFHLIANRSALENVMVGLLHRRIRRSRRRPFATEALQQVGLEDRMHSTPATLSGGEQQRVAIARAIAGKPAVLLCDEPTGNLDSKSTDALMSLLLRLRDGGLTVVVVTHNPAVAEKGDRVVRVRDGRVEEV